MRTVTGIPILALMALSLAAASCRPEAKVQTAPSVPRVESGGEGTLKPGPKVTDSPGPRATSAEAGLPSSGFTYQQPDGNRLAAGKGQLPDIEPRDLALDGRPLWLVAAPLGEGSIWVAILDDGRAEAFHIVGDTVKPIAVEPPRLSPGMPPMLVVEDGSPRLLTGPENDASILTHAVRIAPPIDSSAYITGAGDLAIEKSGERVRIAVNALPDARLLMDEFGRLLLLSDPTTRYGHGVLGDELEAGSITMVETVPSPRVSLRLEIEPEKVIEGIAPIWADLDGDGAREIIVTESDADQGAQIVAYDERGIRVAAGPAIGAGSRWRHQLAVAPFGPNGELELASVLTPHIGGVVEFYQMRGDRLEIVARVPGYSSHAIGSRNLDMAIAGDLDGDGRIELLVPDQAQEILGAIRRNSEGAEAVWSIPIGGKLSSNLAAVAFPNGDMAVGVGREDGVLRLWLPTNWRLAE
ncbi:MAG: hypothetical protein BMS9Abin28_0207 [Anaerolineae bacterium]|nr:MAG: hypothetical protein BMS9Abin28_0207 [Anaerolineae bacterium]